MNPTQKQVTDAVTPRRDAEADPAAMSDADFARWCEAQDARAAESYGEQQRDAYLAYHEAKDGAEMDAVEANAAPAVPTSAVEVDEPRATLLATGRYLFTHGWIQQDYYANSGSLHPAACLVGALAMVSYGYPAEAPAENFSHPAFDTFEAAMCRLGGFLTHTYGRDLGDVYTFNDTPGRNVGEVLTMLHDAAMSDPGLWVPRCCDGQRCELDPDEPVAVIGDPITGDDFAVERVYRCMVCQNRYYVEAFNDNDRDTLWKAYRFRLDELQHHGEPHVPGTSDDCLTCDGYCYCTADRTCVNHLHTVDAEDWPSLDGTGRVRFGATVGGAE